MLALLATALVLGTQQARRVPQPTESSTPQPTPSILQPPTAVNVQWQGDKVIVSWNDPSDGRAQPIVVGSRQNEAPRGMGVPATGFTQMGLAGLNPAYIYCFSAILAYTADEVRESDTVCIDGSARDR